MAKKNNNNVIWIVILAALVAMFFVRQVSVDVGVQDRGVSFRILTYDENKQLIGELDTKQLSPQAIVTFPGGNPSPNTAFIKIEHTITNLGTANTIAMITNLQATNNPGDNLYGPAIAGVTKSFSLDPGESTTPELSGFIDVNDLPTGSVEFRLDVTAHYMDAEGNQVDISTFGTIPIQIEADLCNDGTPVGDCNGQGALCEGNAQDPTPTAGCCAEDSGIWDGSSCSFACGTVPLGECDDTFFLQQVKRATYCNPVTGQLEENCPLCDCVDYFGNAQDSCSGTECVFQDYSAVVEVTLGGEGESGQSSCECTTWVDEACGDGVCTADKMSQSRVCTPSACAVESQCVTDVICEGGQGESVRFRTTSSSYGSGTAVAFTSGACGSTLTAYGYTSARAKTTMSQCQQYFDTAEADTDCGAMSEMVLGNLLGGDYSLWQGTDSTKICVCWDAGSQLSIKMYNTGDSDASKVSTSATSVNPSLEVTC